MKKYKTDIALDDFLDAASHIKKASKKAVIVYTYGDNFVGEFDKEIKRLNKN